jgi:hypothetical protein
VFFKWEGVVKYRKEILYVCALLCVCVCVLNVFCVGGMCFVCALHVFFLHSLFFHFFLLYSPLGVNPFFFCLFYLICTSLFFFC